jgi:hypothetical protein
MFDNIMGWKAQSALGGALGGVSAMDEIMNSGQKRQMNNLDMLIKQLAYDEAQKDSPLRAQERELKGHEMGDQIGAWQSGEMPTIKGAERTLGHQKTLTGIDKERLNKVLAKSEFFVMADQYLESAKDQPHVLAGEGWKHLMDTGAALGIKLGPTYTPEEHAKIKAAAQPATQTIPQLQQLQRMHQQHGFDMTKQGHQQNHEDLKQGRTQAHQTALHQMDNASAEERARIAAAASRENASNRKGSTLEEAKATLASATSFEDAVNKLTYGQAMTLYRDIKTSFEPKVQAEIDMKLAQLRRGSNDPKEAAAAKRFIAERMAEAAGDEGVVIAAVLARGNSGPNGGQIGQSSVKAPSSSLTNFSKQEPKVINGVTYYHLGGEDWTTTKP